MSIQTDLLPVDKLNIWNHQKDAIREIAEYLSAYSNKAFLVKMPTGTGKTGVFACLTRIAYPTNNYIIITPSKALKFQIIEELKDGFWNKIGMPVGNLKDQVIEDLMPHNLDEVVSKINEKKYIIVTTIQALQLISTNDKYKKGYDEIRKSVGCIIFDEGHKEPAYTWGETVRAFKKPTVLFSATPYRNDYKIFNIDKERFYTLEHNFCQKNNILRKIEVRQVVIDVINPTTFTNKLVSEVEKIKPKLIEQGIANPKTIIRCENQSEIEKVVSALIKLNKRVIGIHENFKESKHYSSEVPTFDKQSNYDFFVHQFKLIEGIDNTDFCVVALYSNFSSSRLLIQQIGRVLRNPNKIPNQVAYVFSLNAKNIQEEWNKYLEYDEQMVNKKKLFDVTDVLRVNKDVSTLYFSGTFRDLVDVNNIVLSESLLFQKKVNAFAHDNSISFDELSEQILDEWGKRDYYILKQEVYNQNTILILYIVYQNSPLVKHGIFIEQKLAVTYLNFQKDFIFYYDSEQNSPLFQIESLNPVSKENLTKLFNNKKSITRIFLHNTDIGKRNLRSKELHANSVENTAPGLADHSYFPARMEGYVSESGETKRRYIGFQFGRITEYSATRLEFTDFQDWIGAVKLQLNAALATGKVQTFLNRFSNKVDPPDDATPVSILLDIDSDLLYQYTFGTGKKDLYFEDLCSTIESGQFKLTVNETEFIFRIEYNTMRKRYNVTCEEFDEMTEAVNPDAQSLLATLNSEQAFRIIVSGNQYVYAYKNFYRPGLNLISKKKDLDIKQLFHKHDCVSRIKSEKGNDTLKVVSGKWHMDTLFGLISRFGKGYKDKAIEDIFTFDYMICDDLSAEIADFIALDTINKKVVFIHAKTGDSKLSASAFQEICGQATKNLDYLTPYYQAEPVSNIKRWNENWSIGKIGSVKRLIHGTGNARDFWTKYVSLISDPSVSREVWMFVGNLFDYGTFEKEINKNKIENVKPEVIQLIYLLRSTWDSVSSVGAQLKIFC